MVLGPYQAGSDNHLILIDLSSLGVTGKDAELSLERAGLTCNKNSVPNDSQSPFVTSGIRLGAAAATTRGFSDPEFKQISAWICDVLTALSQGKSTRDIEKRIASEVKELCAKFPIYTQGY